MVDFDSFLRWANDRFNGDVVVKNNEIKINSIFVDDTKHHMWCSVTGGKHNREDGCYRCFYTDRKGTLVGLVMLVEQCSYEEAKEILNGQTNMRVLEERLDEFFKTKVERPKRPESKIKLPDHCFLISELPESNFYRTNVEKYLESRKIPIDGLYYCINGEFRNRIVIPYYDCENKLIYWNSRHLDKKIKPRYRGPEKSVGVGKGDVLYATEWPEPGSKIYLVEGEFDAITLRLCGFYGMACGGKTLSDTQLEIIRSRGYKVCLGPDNDKKALESASPGRLGMIEMAKKLFSIFIQVTYVFPPKNIKDWNDLLIVYNKEVVAGYINKCEKSLDSFTIEQLMCFV